jgi:A/G-specific adenine glycosylase
VNERPGLWGQALMELGSTVCTPKPNCAACPITGTCRAYAEGLALAEGRGRGEVVEDIEDPCTLCVPYEEVAEDENDADEPKNNPTEKKGALSRFFAPTQNAKPTTTPPGPDARTLNIIINHARKFPLKKPKRKVRKEETLVCAIRCSDGRYLIHQRPAKGLLGGLWELPSYTLPESNDSTPKSRRTQALSFVSGLVAMRNLKRAVKHVGELGSVPWLFSHLKLTMHVHLFEVDNDEGLPAQGPRKRWASAEDIDAESMGTGMKKCWALVKQQAG